MSLSSTWLSGKWIQSSRKALIRCFKPLCHYVVRFLIQIVGMLQVSCPSLQGRYLASNVMTRTLTLSATFATPAHCKQIDR